MEIEKQQLRTIASRRSFYLKCGAVFLLLSLSVLVIACGSSDTPTTAGANGPQVTVTIKFNNGLSSSGTVAPYLCGAWITNTTPGFNPGSEIPVYARFVHEVNGNPVGVNGASASANVEWADGGRASQGGTTSSDGLAVFYFTIPNRPDMVGKNNLVTVSFSGPNGQACSVDNQPQPAAFFTLVVASPTPTVTPSTAPTIQGIQTVTVPGVTPPIFVPPGRGGGGGGGNQPTPAATCSSTVFGC
ncbi:MAG TPA: hypothetical protein VGL94_13585 [Ktedonobacteraceae bacterium]|jgi:hypothetical protein